MNRYEEVDKRAETIAEYGSLAQALALGHLQQFQDISVSEAVVLGLLNQGVCKYIGILGHGNTDIANILSRYERNGLVKFYNVHHETEAAHCASMLKWQYGETAAVLASIGPGALHAFAGSLVSASNGLGVYHIYGDETTQDEGPNMQQLPKRIQAGFLKLAETMGSSYQVHTPEAIFTALRRGAASIFNPGREEPFYLLLPMNIQPNLIKGCNLAEIPERPLFPRIVCTDSEVFMRATKAVRQAKAITIKFGGGAKDCGREIEELADLIDAVVVSGAKMSGVVPFSNPRFMSVGGSKGSICGNFAMENADLVIVIGSRAVCQWDCSGTAWKRAGAIINFNTNIEDAGHYNRSTIILGDARSNLQTWIQILKSSGFASGSEDSVWVKNNRAMKEQWLRFKQERFDHPVLFDEVWGREVLTQPAAIRVAYDFAREKYAARYFDAGDVQANGFQVVEDEEYGLTFSDTGASYMGFSVCALLSAALADDPTYGFAFTGDGSFTMNPQILFDGVEHGLRGCIVLLDNRRMAAITGLQNDQYQTDYKTSDRVETDYLRLARSVKGVKAIAGGTTPDELRSGLEQAYGYDGLSLIHVPVYAGDHELGGLGVFGAWNVGNWCEEVQKEHHRLGF
ncbi:MAG: thiamine pyrophosphate-binding protein [Spirochaetaceae bacterium]|nr:MAG: thiamine pyrophosphate-binding protein [Spirochaetaceae bacterium]